MPLASRKGKRNIKKAVPINSALYFGFSTKDLVSISGVGSTEITALGQVDPDTVTGKPVVFGCNSPKGARFTLKLEGQSQDSVTSFGDGLKVLTAQKAGWKLVKPIQACNIGFGKRLTGIVVPMSNGLYLVELVANADVGLASTFGWETSRTDTVLNKLVKNCTLLKAARVARKSDGAQFPCAKAKLSDVVATGEYELVSPEVVGTGSVSEAAPGA
jgi:hypothetical protein